MGQLLFRSILVVIGVAVSVDHYETHTHDDELYGMAMFFLVLLILVTPKDEDKT